MTDARRKALGARAKDSLSRSRDLRLTGFLDLCGLCEIYEIN